MIRGSLLSVWFAFLPALCWAQAKSDTTNSGKWEFEAGTYYYILPDESDKLTLVGYADYNAIHLEARYNYEDKNTASVFGGYRFETGSEVTFGFTPIGGIVFGNTNGFAPGLILDISYGILDLYAESEYVVSWNDKEDNFFYMWSEFGVTPTENLRTGISADRTRLYQTGLEIQKGIFAQYSFGQVTAGLHFFNPLSPNHFFIATLGIEF